MTKFMLVCVLFSIVFISCGYPSWVSDKRLGREVFMECLKNIPKGPDRVVANDWDEVVYACKIIAMDYGQICVKNCDQLK